MMIGNAFFTTTVLFLALGFFLLGECRFLIPYRQLLLEAYGRPIGLFAAALFINLFAAVYFLCRTLFLADTGRKLAHLEKQLRTGASVSDELSRRLDE
jgi:hypothetical protein